jgi:prephenate dehydrogenase
MDSLWRFKMRWQNISIIGAGLLGGSLALALKRRPLDARVRACVRRDASVDECRKLEIADGVTTDLKEAVEGAELVVLCTPLSRMAALAAAMRPFLKQGAVVTDVGSVKSTVVKELEPIVLQARAEFVGSHPMAGSERTGVAAARADLFDNAVCLVTPGRYSSPQAIAGVEEFWRAVGGRPIRLNPEAHDDLVSRSSHLPHVVAAELANYILSPVHPKEQRLVCANGFRDTTRIASGSPEMWRDIALANRKNLGRVLGVFIEDLQEFQLALEREDVRAIEEFFANAKERRDEWRAHSPAASPE